jgi:fumarate reductase subunit D
MNAGIDRLKRRISQFAVFKKASNDSCGLPKSKWTSVRGWLILAIICLILQSLIIADDFKSFFRWTTDDIINPDLKAIAWAAIVHDVVMILFGVVLAAFFFAKKRAVPKLIASWFGAEVLGKVVIAVINTYALGVNRQLDRLQHYVAPHSPAVSICALQDWAFQLNGVIIVALVLAGIMIPYFFASKQVKATFVR